MLKELCFIAEFLKILQDSTLRREEFQGRREEFQGNMGTIIWFMLTCRISDLMLTEVVSCISCDQIDFATPVWKWMENIFEQMYTANMADSILAESASN